MTCYREGDEALFNNSIVDRPCPGTEFKNGHSRCCTGDDLCLDNNICHYTHSQTGGSGYYVASCTDPTYADTTACIRVCADMDRPDIVYFQNMSSWYCCGEGNTCESPTDESLEGPSTAVLLAAYSAGTSVATSAIMSSSTSTSEITSTSASASTTYTLTTDTTTSPSATSIISSSTATTDHGSSTCSGGIIAGIAVRGAVGLIIAAGLGYWLSRRRQNSAHKVHPDPQSTRKQEHDHYFTNGLASHKAELSGYVYRSELPTSKS